MKYQLEQVIHYMQDNKPHSAPVLARMHIDNLHDSWGSNKEQRKLFTPFGPAGTYYATCHGLVSEANAYASKEDLLGQLVSA